jgi:hypothetical protein
VRFTVHRIACDRCGTPAQSLAGVEELWGILEGQGWEHRDIDGQPFDLCADCATQRFEP